MNNTYRIKSFKKPKDLANLVECVKSFGAYHRSYCWYTSLDRVLQTIKYRRLWLTRLDPGVFDDGIEHKKYGLDKERKRTYIRSFMYGIQESVAMWGLYCQPTYKAIRMNITQKAMKLLLGRKVYKTSDNGNTSDECKVKESAITDLLYAAVENKEEERPRVNKLHWNGFYSKPIANLKNEKGRRYATGIVKDAEWRFENECRLVCKVVKDCEEHVAVDLPIEFFNEISFVLSPWANAYEREFVCKQIRGYFSNIGKEVDANDGRMFQRSKLESGLQKWARERGL